jgi:hypothetical protein
MTDLSKNPRANPDGESASGHKFRFATGRDGTIQPMGGMCECHVFVPVYAWIPNEPGYCPGMAMAPRDPELQLQMLEWEHIDIYEEAGKFPTAMKAIKAAKMLIRENAARGRD